MATRYSDIITLGTSRTVYNIREEGPKDWESFIANDQFNALLDKTVKAVMNNDPDNHKSIWMAGTYGSGKSHAGAVLKHLLCDPVNEIMHYVDALTCCRYVTANVCSPSACTVSKAFRMKQTCPCKYNER